MGLSVKNDESNVGKVCHLTLCLVWATSQLSSSKSAQPLRDVSQVRRVLARYGPQRVATVRALLEAEKASGVHRPGPILADPSAAMALLWMRRTIQVALRPRGRRRAALD
eukprot:scaffold231829_cov32-Tisochrysis_lutea.AAC.2